MESDQLMTISPRTELINDTHKFLRGLAIGYPLSDLLVILRRMRVNEARLRQEEKVMLDPDMWNFFHTKLFQIYGEPPEWCY